jgi:hypothetical protein
MTAVAMATADTKQILLLRSTQNRLLLGEQLRQSRSDINAGRGIGIGGNDLAARRILFHLALACLGREKVAVLLSIAGRTVLFARTAQEILQHRKAMPDI